MSWIAVGLGVASLLGSSYSSARQSDAQKKMAQSQLKYLSQQRGMLHQQRQKLQDIYEQQTSLAKSEFGESAGLQKEAAGAQFRALAGKTGFESSGQVEYQAEQKEEDIMRKYNIGLGKSLMEAESMFEEGKGMIQGQLAEIGFQEDTARDQIGASDDSILFGIGHW
jgi:hypothetical protein|tara:strand:- start:152 stop:652 length:501 start_codon:yes stop_codon:yes gene_type:complete